MKNFSIGLNIVLLLAVGFLYYAVFSDKGSEITEQESESSDTTEVIDYDIAYINSDSLIKKYQFFIDKQGELSEKQQGLEKEYRNRATGLQAEIEDFQKTAGNMTINQARAIEEDLVKKQQNLVKYQDNIRVQLLQAESQMNTEIYAEIDELLETYGKENDLRIVLSYVYGGGILYADNALDITEEVIEKLNERYQQKNTGE